MSKVLLIGMSPLPFENDRKVYGTGIRTWQFLQPLLGAGHEVCLVSFAIPSAYPEGFGSKHIKKFSFKDTSFAYHLLDAGDFNDTALLSGIKDDFGPDCVIGCTFYPSYIASKIKGGIPFWADLFGHVMAEAQARAAIDDDDSCLFHYWNGEYNIISSADLFSCVCQRQEYALIGELGAAGRLNRHTSGYAFTTSIPCGMPRQEYKHTKKVIRGQQGVGDDDFVFLWTGGYNTWTDIDTLFSALQKAMAKDSSIRFVSTGGEIPEQDTKTYPKFLSLIENSRYRERFIMKGWIRGEDVPNYYLEADAGINIDKDIYEVRLGSKNRILDWMRAGLCVLSSNVCELTQIIEDEGIGYTFRPHDSQDLCRKLLHLASHREETRSVGQKGRDYGLENFNFSTTTVKLKEWAASPCHAPDFSKEKKIFFDKEEALKKLESISCGQKKVIAEKDKRISELKAVLDRGFAYRAYHYMRALKRKIR